VSRSRHRTARAPTAAKPSRAALPAVAAVIAFLASPALGQEARALPLWEVGGIALGASQLAYPGSSQHVRRGLAVPYAFYRGEFLRVDRETAGIRAVRTPVFELDIGAAASFGAGSDEIDVRRGMPDLGTFVEFGPRLKWHLAGRPGGHRLRADFALRGVFDLTDRLKDKGLAFEPELVYESPERGRWGTILSVGAIWGDRRLADTFYGVAPAYATTARPVFVAESGRIALRGSAWVWRDLSNDLRLYGYARADSVSGAANTASPLVQRTTGATVGAGVVYTWKRSRRVAID